MKNIIPKILIFTFLIIFSHESNSQYELLKGINQDLRKLFSQITFPDSSVNFLQQRSAKLIDSTYYTHYNPDSILYAGTWLQMYEEMYYAAHDTNDYPPVDSVLNRMERENIYSCDTIDMAIMNVRLYQLKKEALESGTYFIFDTVNDILYNNPGNLVSPYTLDSLFIASPMENVAYNKDVNYKISPENIFADSKTYNEMRDKYWLQIDFGDGLGFRTINPDVVSSEYALYPTKGTYPITTQLVDKSTNVAEYLSKSEIRILSDIACKYPDSVFRVPGMAVGVYKTCTDPTLPTKKIIIVEGFDPMGTYGPTKYYDKIVENQLDVMGNFGYEYYIINWLDARKDMRLNAYSLLLLIEKMKQDSKAIGDDQQFVIVGASMGGLIARYTLNYMESDHYQNNDYEPFFVEAGDPYTLPFLIDNPRFNSEWRKYANDVDRLKKLHNCRLFISVDAPHQGAAIPIAYQYLYRLADPIASTAFTAAQCNLVLRYLLKKKKVTREKLDYTLSMLDGKSPRQLLKNWVPKANTTAYSGKIFGANSSHYSFYRQMKSFQGADVIPRFCKTVALSDGAMDGSRNQNVHTGAPRPTNDIMLKVDHALDARILWLRVNLMEFKAELRTNPEMVEKEILNIQLGVRLYYLKLYWFGVKVDHLSIPLIRIRKKIKNIHSYATGAGGTSNILASTNINAKTYHYGKNDWKILGGFLGWQTTGSVTSNGLDVCFVPTESALDYTGGSLPWSNDLLTTGKNNLNYLLAHTPFDVIAGEIHRKKNPITSNKNIKNFEHGDIRNENDFVYNLTRSPAQGAENALLSDGKPDEKAEYAFHTCALSGNYGAKRTWLSMEIGDEELYLENFSLPYTATYRPEYNVKVNKRNPNYYYTSSQTIHSKVGIFSKDDNFDIINPTGYAQFEIDGANSPALPALTGETSLNGPFGVRDEPFAICCQASLAPWSENETPAWTKQTTKEYELLVFPNPTQLGQNIFIKSQLPSQATQVTVELMNLAGQVVHRQLVPKSQGEANFQHTVNLFNLELTSGLYLIKLQAGEKTLTEKILIH